MSKCRDVMTANPVCCLSSDTIERVAQLMKIHDVGSIPVVEHHSPQQVVGIVTDRDLVVNVLANGRASQSPITSAMTPDPVTCYEDDNLDYVLQLMSDHQVRRIPVLNSKDEIVGIIAQADIATRLNQPIKTAEVVEAISQPANGA
ncbi:MAG: CBS domain-containing protein [Chloroflexi bacterium]|nr:CBS domain-containing protein [Chloroflexota bacterium]